MKLNISYPPSGSQKCIDVDDEKKYRIFYDKRISQDVEADALGDQFKGYVVKIMGGNDKQGFPMKQGVLTNTRVRLLVGAGASCYRPRRNGERKRKSVRGCIVGSDISALHLVIVKKGAEEIPDLTDKYVPRRLGPKRASKIRKLFNLTKTDDVRKYVIRREIPLKEGKTKKRTKAPKIQRLVTPQVLQHKRHRLALKKKRVVKHKEEAAEYAKLLAVRNKERREKRRASLSVKATARVSGKKDAAPVVAKKDSTTAPAKATPVKATTAPVKATTPAKATVAPVKSAAPTKAAAPATKTAAPATKTAAPAQKASTQQPAKGQTKKQ